MTEEMEESLFNVLRTICKGLEGHSSSLDSSLSQLRSSLINFDQAVSEDVIQDVEQNIRILHLERQENSQDFLDIGASWHRSLMNRELESNQKQQLLAVEPQFREMDSRVYQIPAKLRLLLEVQLALDKSAKDKNSTVDPIILKRVAQEIVELLRQITPSDKSAAQYRALISQLEMGLDLDVLPIVIGRVSTYIEAALTTKGDDFSVYLQDLNKQLSEVQTFIAKAHPVDHNSVKMRNIIDDKVRDSVVNIRASVEQATEVETLQKELSGQLNTILGAMDTLKTQEKKRDDTLQDNYNALQQRVKVMEKEAEKVQDYIAEERKSARLDALTGLPNRTAYNEFMDLQIERFSKAQEPLSLVICDLDHFKKVNDNYGHLAGDKVLSLVAKILSKSLSQTDMVARYGGEEFAIIMPATPAPIVEKAMDRVRRLICKSPFNYRGEPISISMSFGVCQAIEGDNIESLFLRADAALYKAKEKGRNIVVVAK